MSKSRWVRYYEMASEDSRHDFYLWLRYLRKSISRQQILLSESDQEQLLSSPVLTRTQKAVLTQALIPGTPTHERICRMNEKARTPVLDRVKAIVNARRKAQGRDPREDGDESAPGGSG